jgi:hypothetical protein
MKFLQHHPFYSLNGFLNGATVVPESTWTAAVLQLEGMLLCLYLPQFFFPEGGVQFKGSLRLSLQNLAFSS